MKEQFIYKMFFKRKLIAQSHAYDTAGECLAATRLDPLFAKASAVVILRDSGGTDHPDNAGKFFLHWVLK